MTTPATATAPSPSTGAGRRRHYEHFATDIAALCRIPGTRAALRAGRGRPVKDCLDAPGELRRLAHGHGAVRAHYTVAALIALADPHTTPEGRSAATGPGTAEAAATPASDPDSGPGRAPGPDFGPDPAADRDPAHDLDAYRAGTWRRRPNLGATLALAVRHAGWGETRTEELLRVLARVGEDQLHRRLPSLAGRLLRDGLAPDWPVLLDDLARRPYDRNEVATAWQDAFYLALPPSHPRKDSRT